MIHKLWFVTGFVLSSLLIQAQGPLKVTFLYEHQSGLFDQGGVERMAFDENGKKYYTTNASQLSFNIYGFKGKNAVLEKTISVSNFVGSINDIDASNGLVAVIGNAGLAQLPGKLLLYDTTGSLLKVLTVGPAPKRVRFNQSGARLFITNEGVPSNDYLSDPKGGLSIVDIGANDPRFLTQQAHDLLDFSILDSTQNIDSNVRIFGNNGKQTIAQDLEPEQVALDEQRFKAYVSLPENNALAIFDYGSRSLDTVVPLGYKDWSDPALGLDASDAARNINIRSYPSLYGMYQATDIETFRVNGELFVLTVNEGAFRDFTGYSELTQVKDLFLDPNVFTNLSQLIKDTMLGNLRVTTTMGDADSNFVYTELYAYGGRSFSIRDSLGRLIWDSGKDLEQITATLEANSFNSAANDNNSRKARSSYMGPQPTAVAINFTPHGLTAVIALGEMGGYLFYDLQNPRKPSFMSYELRRDFSVPASSAMAGDLGPQEISLQNLTSTPLGVPTLFAANAVSGNLSVYGLGSGVGLEEEKHHSTPRAFPNPTPGIVEITGDPAIYKVYNAQGKCVKTTAKTQRIDLRHLPKGYYLIKNNEGATLKVIRR